MERPGVFHTGIVAEDVTRLSIGSVSVIVVNFCNANFKS